MPKNKKDLHCERKRKDQPPASSEQVRNRMCAVRQKDTAAEILVRRALHRMGLRYRVHVALLPNLRRKADIVFSRKRIAVMIDGCFWHGCPLHGSMSKVNVDFWTDKIATNQRRDRDTDRRLLDAGWTVIRVWEHEDPFQAAIRIARAVRGGQADE